MANCKNHCCRDDGSSFSSNFHILHLPLTAAQCSLHRFLKVQPPAGGGPMEDGLQSLIQAWPGRVLQ